MAHRHRPHGEPEIRCYSGAVTHPENRAAHGNIREVASCTCGAERHRNLNQGYVESSGWIEPEELGA